MKNKRSESLYNCNAGTQLELFERIDRVDQNEYLSSIEKRDGRSHFASSDADLCRRDVGSYYTPEPVVNFIISSTIGPKLNEKGKIDLASIKCIDPSMGTGNFLVGVVRYLAPILAKRNKLSLKKACKLVAENCLFGVDIDKVAIEAAISRIASLTGAESSILKRNFLVSDGLNLDLIKRHFSFVFAKNRGFTFVVGNPPYVDYRKVSSATKAFFKEFESTRGAGKVNLYVPFIEACFKLCSPSGGVGLIVPNQWLSNNQGTQLRTSILPNLTHIIDISHLRIFADAETYPVIMLADFLMKNEISVAELDNISSLSGKINFTKVSKAVISRSAGAKIKTTINPALEKISKILDALPRLEDFVDDFLWGTSQSGYGKKKVTLNHLKSDFALKAKYIKMLQTADIKKMEIEWQKEFLPKSVYTQAQLERFKKKKVVIARLTKSLQCAFDDEGYALGKASFITHHDEDLLKALTVIMSSTLISQWFRYHFTNVHMAGGYLRYDIPYLKQIPIPELDQKTILKLSSFHDRFQSSKNIAALDKIVNEVYGVTLDTPIVEPKSKKVA